MRVSFVYILNIEFVEIERQGKQCSPDSKYDDENNDNDADDDNGKSR